MIIIMNLNTSIYKTVYNYNNNYFKMTETLCWISIVICDLEIYLLKKIKKNEYTLN